MLTLIKLGKKAGHSTSAEQGKFRRAKKLRRKGEVIVEMSVRWRRGVG